MSFSSFFIIKIGIWCHDNKTNKHENTLKRQRYKIRHNYVSLIGILYIYQSNIHVSVNRVLIEEINLLNKGQLMK